LDRRLLGGALVTSQGLHAGLHHRARIYGEIQPEFGRRNVKVIGLSVDPVGKHEQWADDIEETQGSRPTYPIIGDSDFNVSKLYGMLPASISGDPAQRTPADNQNPAQQGSGYPP